MTSEEDEWFYHENLNHIPAITHPNPAFGPDHWWWRRWFGPATLKYPGIERVVVCELDAGVVAIAEEYFGKVHVGAFHDPEAGVGDCRWAEICCAMPESFDLIILDLTDPQGYAEPFYTQHFCGLLPE